MSTAWILGFLVGILFVAVFCLVARHFAVKKGKPREYDERQMAARGRGFAVAYAVIMIWLALWFLANSLSLPFFGENTALLIGIFASIAVFVGYSIFHDAYFRTADRPRAWLAVLTAVCLMNLAIGARGAAAGGAPWYENVNLLTGLMLLSILVCLLVKWMMDRRAGEE